MLGFYSDLVDQSKEIHVTTVNIFWTGWSFLYIQHKQQISTKATTYGISCPVLWLL